MNSIANWIKKHQLVTFFALSYLITFGVSFGYIFLRPGQPLRLWSVVWFFEVFAPTLSALIVTSIAAGKTGLKRLLSGYTRWKVGFFWYFAAAFLFLGPLVITQVYRLLGNETAGIMPGETVSTILGTVLFLVFSGPVAEELGWRGFALPRLQEKYNAFASSLILGVIWTCWHIPFFFLTGATQMSIPFPVYLVLVLTITLYLTWLYNNTGGSLIITILAHFFYNLTGILTSSLGLMPPMKFYMTAGPLLFLVVVAVIFVYGPRHFSKKPVSELPAQITTAAAER